MRYFLKEVGLKKKYIAETIIRNGFKRRKSLLSENEMQVAWPGATKAHVRPRDFNYVKRLVEKMDCLILAKTQRVYIFFGKIRGSP